MLKYLVILLDDCSVSYCHYDNSNERNLIPLEILHKGILFAMKNDLKIQYVLPQGELPQSYIEVINSMFHDNIGSIGQEEMADVIVVNGMEELTQNENKFDASKRYVIRTTVKEFFERYDLLKNVFERNMLGAKGTFCPCSDFFKKAVNTDHVHTVQSESLFDFDG